MALAGPSMPLPVPSQASPTGSRPLSHPFIHWVIDVAWGPVRGGKRTVWGYWRMGKGLFVAMYSYHHGTQSRRGTLCSHAYGDHALHTSKYCMYMYMYMQREGGLCTEPPRGALDTSYLLCYVRRPVHFMQAFTHPSYITSHASLAFWLKQIVFGIFFVRSANWCD